jgi:uncharacterized protein
VLFRSSRSCRSACYHSMGLFIGDVRMKAYETGTNTWRQYGAWPFSCEAGCGQSMQSIVLRPGLKPSFGVPTPDGAAYTEYVSDPAQPVLYDSRPVLCVHSRGSSWPYWLVRDQRTLSKAPAVCNITMLRRSPQPAVPPISRGGFPLMQR